MDGEGPDHTAQMRRESSALTASMCLYWSLIDVFLLVSYSEIYFIHSVVSKDYRWTVMGCH